MTLKIRWLIRRDMSEVLEIESACFEFVWTEEDFLCCLRQSNCIGMVVEHDGRVVGFIIYELHQKSLRILNLAVHPDHHRQGVGTALINRLKEKIGQQRRDEISAEVRESNLDAQYFFKSQGFHAIKVLREHYDVTDEDAYFFSFVCLVGVEA